MSTWELDPRFLALADRVRAGEPVEHEAFDDLLMVMPRSDRLFNVMVCGHGFPLELLRALLAGWWRDAEYPYQLGQERIVGTFHHAGFVTDTDGVTPPAEPLTVYRGVSLETTSLKPLGPRGVSWTLDEEKAAWFARRWSMLGHAGRIYVAEAPPTAVLGIFHGRQEAEVVVNPRRLRKVRTLRDPPGKPPASPPPAPNP